MYCILLGGHHGIIELPNKYTVNVLHFAGRSLRNYRPSEQIYCKCIAFCWAVPLELSTSRISKPWPRNYQPSEHIYCQCIAFCWATCLNYGSHLCGWASHRESDHPKRRTGVGVSAESPGLLSLCKLRSPGDSTAILRRWLLLPSLTRLGIRHEHRCCTSAWTSINNYNVNRVALQHSFGPTHFLRFTVGLPHSETKS